MVHILGSAVFAAVGVLAIVMADKGLRADRLLSFHQAGTAREWASLSPGEQAVGLALTRTVGLGFASTALALVGAAIAGAMGLAVVALPLAGVGLVFCLGLSWVNRALAVSTSVNTPWRGSLMASALIAVGMVLVSL